MLDVYRVAGHLGHAGVAAVGRLGLYGGDVPTVAGELTGQGNPERALGSGDRDPTGEEAVGGSAKNGSRSP